VDFGFSEPRSIPKSKIQNSGFYTDMARTVGIGKISQDAARLIRVTEEALGRGVRMVRAGARLGDIGHAIEMHLKKEKLGIIRDLAGHGVGYELHEEPLIPNFGTPGTGFELQEGMVIAIEPMITVGGYEITTDPDRWTIRTQDRSLCAHFEHTIIITDSEPIVATRRPNEI
jgi:methionyl aminopeptidase